MSGPNPKVDWYFARDNRWAAANARQREIILATGLTEVLKWGCPCYADAGHNVVLIHDFKDYCAILFFKGAVLDDPAGLLIQQTENVQAARQLRFSSLDEVNERAALITDYVNRAVAADRAGVSVPMKSTEDFPVPDELKAAFGEHPGLKGAFEALTPGRQRGYVLHFSGAKQAATRTTRVEKSIDRILDGKGINDV